MKRIVGIIQEHMFSNEDIQHMQAGFTSIYKKHFKEEKLQVAWMVMPTGYAYSERKPSNAAVIVIEVHEEIDQPKRERYSWSVGSF